MYKNKIIAGLLGLLGLAVFWVGAYIAGEVLTVRHWASFPTMITTLVFSLGFGGVGLQFFCKP
jgi:hypothetical protein